MSATVKRKGLLQDRLAALDAGVKSGLINGGTYFVRVAKRNLDMMAPKGRAKGDMIRTLSSGVSPVAIVNGVYKCRVGPSGKYPYWFHQGTGIVAGKGPRKQPPTEAILEWVKTKKIVPMTMSFVGQARNTKGQFSSGKSLYSKRRKKVDIERDQRALAFLIARKIGRTGTYPNPFLSSAFNVCKLDIRKIILSSVIRALSGGK